MTLPTEEDISWLEHWSTMQPVMKQKFASAAREALRLRKWMERIRDRMSEGCDYDECRGVVCLRLISDALAGKECP